MCRRSRRIPVASNAVSGGVTMPLDAGFLKPSLGLYLTGALLLLGCVAGVWQAGDANGDKRATALYKPQLDTLKGALEQADFAAHEGKRLQEIENENLRKASAVRAASHRNYYERLLADERAHTASGGAATGCNAGDDEAASQSATAGRLTTCAIEIERNCVADADRVNEWRAWCVAHRCPVE